MNLPRIEREKPTRFSANNPLCLVKGSPAFSSQGTFPKAREKRPGDEVGSPEMLCPSNPTSAYWGLAKTNADSGRSWIVDHTASQKSTVTVLVSFSG